MAKISLGDARQLLERIVGDWKDSKDTVTKEAHISRDWLDHQSSKGIETDRMFYTSPYAKFVVGFVDDSPAKKWPHVCRYVFISDDGRHSVVNNDLPPRSMTKYRFEQVIPPPDYQRVIVV